MSSSPIRNSVISIVAGDYHTCAITDDNDLYCWGGNRWGQLGDGMVQSGSIIWPWNALVVENLYLR